MRINLATLSLALVVPTFATPTLPLNPRAAVTKTCTVASATPSPKNTLCGVYGELLNASQIGFGDGDPNSCALQCLQLKHCVSFTYEAHFGYCGFFNKTLKEQKYTKTESTDLSCWNRKCFVKECS